MKGKWKNPEDPLNILAIVSIAVVSLLLILLFKIKGGILGVVLGTITMAMLIYWLKEIKNIFREEKTYPIGEAEWFYDLIDDGEGVTFVVKVPGPAEEVKAKLLHGALEIRGGGNFVRMVQMPKEVQLQTKSYINGVLHVRLQRVKTPTKKTPSTN